MEGLLGFIKVAAGSGPFWGRSGVAGMLRCVSLGRVEVGQLALEVRVLTNELSQPSRAFGRLEIRQIRYPARRKPIAEYPERIPDLL